MAEKFLIIKTSSLGDIIHAYPCISYLRKKFPEAQIDWVVEAPYAGLVQGHPDISNTYCIETKMWRKKPFSMATLKAVGSFRRSLRARTYDAVFDLQGNTKSGLVLALTRSKNKVGFGFKSVPEYPNLLFSTKRFNPPPNGNIRHDYLALVSSYFEESTPNEVDGHPLLTITKEQKAYLTSLLGSADMKKKQKILVCPGSAWRNKQLPPETLAQFLSLINNRFECAFLFVWGSPEERQMAESLKLRFPDNSSIIDKMPLPMLQNIMARCDLIIAMDSLPLHLAGTTATRTFSVFGASSAAKYKPSGARHCSYQGICPYGRSFEKRCPILRTCATGACIRDLKAQDLFDHFLYSLD